MTGKTLMLKNVRLAFTQNLFVPTSFKDQADKPKKYSCKLLIRKDHPQIAPRRDGREVALDLPPMVFSQDAVLAGGEISRAPSTPFGLPT